MADQESLNKQIYDGSDFVCHQNSGGSTKKKKNRRKSWKNKSFKIYLEPRGKEEEMDLLSDITSTSSMDNLVIESTELDDEVKQDITDTSEDSLVCRKPNLLEDDAEENDENNLKTRDFIGFDDNCTIISDLNLNQEYDSNIEFNTVQRNIFGHDIQEAVVDGQMSKPPDIMLFSEETNERKTILNNDLEDEISHETIYNSRFLLKDTKTYEVENFTKNAMIILNHFDIDGYNKRYGTEKDVEALKDTFGHFGFANDMIVHDDLDYREIDKALGEFSKSDFTEYGCVAVVVLTHGSEGGYIRAKDRSYHESELIAHFFDKNNQTLVTKPKIFIIQACRGTRASTALVAGRSALVQRDAAKTPQVYTLPAESDVLLLHSSYAGTAAHREIKNGSWFIQTLCHHVNSLADTTDLEAIMTEVKNDVAINKLHEVYNRGTRRTDINKQIPVVMSTLIRKLYLKKPKDAPFLYEEEIETTETVSMIDTEAVLPRNREVDYGRFIFPRQHFLHMRCALRIFHERAPAACSTSQILLNIANSIDENIVPDVTMNTTAREISDYLKRNAVNWDLYDMIMFLDTY